MHGAQIAEYARKAQGAHLSRETIRANLLRVGWQSSMVDPVLNDVFGPDIPPEQKGDRGEKIQPDPVRIAPGKENFLSRFRVTTPNTRTQNTPQRQQHEGPSDTGLSTGKILLILFLLGITCAGVYLTFFR